MSKKENREFWDDCMDKLDDKYIEESASLKSKPVFNPKILVGATAVAACLALNVGVIALINRSNNELPTSSGETPISDVTTTPITEDTITTTTPPIDDLTTTTVTVEDVTEKIDISKVGFDTHFKFNYNSEGNNYYDLALTLVDSETDENITSMVVENPFVTDGDCVMPGDAYMPSVCQSIQSWQINCFLLTNNVDVYRILPVVIPGIKDGEVCNAVSLYMLTDEEIIRLNGEDIYTSNARLFMNEDDPQNIISFMNLSGGITNCVIDFEANTYTLCGVMNDMGDDYVVATNEVLSKFEFDSKIHDGDDYLRFFRSSWANDDEILEIDLINRADVEFCFGDVNGKAFVIKHTESEKCLYDIYYINIKNEDIMYAYRNLPENFDEVSLYDYTEVYQRIYNQTQRTNTYIFDSIVELSRWYPREVLDIQNLYNVKVDDTNGKVWSRGDISSEEGWLPMIATVYSNDGFDGALLKMTNDEGEEKHISFETMINFPEGEHCVIDMPLSESREHENTQLYLKEKLWVERMPESTLIENYEYFVCSDGSYYALVNFGADQAQWLDCSELFYFENGSYQLLSDDLGLTRTYIVDDELYVFYSTLGENDDYDLCLRIYKNKEVFFDATILERAHIYDSVTVFVDGYILITGYDGSVVIRENDGWLEITKPDILISVTDDSFTLTYNGVEYTTADEMPDEAFIQYK